MIISMIAAMGENRVIGKDNDIPWHLPDDFNYFKTKTQNHFVIMGRRNWESLPDKFKPLPNRTNIVITSQGSYAAEGAQITHSLEDALSLAESSGDEECFIIGGGEIYRMALPKAVKIYLTEIHGSFEGDVTFPELPSNDWKETSRVHHPADDRHLYSFDFVVYEHT